MHDAERQFEIEEQRARMQATLREADQAILVSVDGNGQLGLIYMNINAVERRGLIDILQDTKPRFFPDGER